MMKMMKLTKERLQEIECVLSAGALGCSVDGNEVLAMARQLLASMEQEPVAYMYKDRLHTDARFSLHTRFGNWSQEDINEYEITEIPLYAAPQLPQPAVVPPEYATPARADNEWQNGYCIGWNACRAAMLQGAEPVSQPYTLPDEITYKQAYCAMRSTSLSGCYRDGWNDCRAAMLEGKK